MTKVAALNGGEVDWWENPPLDLLPVLSANPDVTVQKADPLGRSDDGSVQPSSIRRSIT